MYQHVYLHWRKKLGFFWQKVPATVTQLPADLSQQQPPKGCVLWGVTQAGSEPARDFSHFAFPLPETKAVEEKRCVSRKLVLEFRIFRVTLLALSVSPFLWDKRE